MIIASWITKGFAQDPSSNRLLKTFDSLSIVSFSNVDSYAKLRWIQWQLNFEFYAALFKGILYNYILWSFHLLFPSFFTFYHSSVIYSPSLDQIGPSESMVEPPPAYDTVISIMLQPLNPENVSVVSPAVDDVEEASNSIMVLPPKYEDAMQPLPVYSERHCENSTEDGKTCSKG